MMNCNTEEECTQIARLLRPTEFALLDWAINLMAEVVQFDHQNKMNARNIAMVFAPNMTQMRGDEQHHHDQFLVLDILVEALRKSLVVPSTSSSSNFSREDDFYSLDIGWSSDVHHVSHVTFDRFNGFLGFPAEFQPEIPRRVPSASVSVFGVSPESMQCSYDHRGNIIPTILLMMQTRLYYGGGLQVSFGYSG